MRYVLAVAISLITAFPAAAKPVTYECDIDISRTRGWISEKLFMEVDEAAGTASVLDGVIYNFEGDKPKPAKYRSKSKQFVLSWIVSVKDSRGNITKMRYQATYLKGSGEAIISARPGQQYQGNFRGRGKCRTS